MTELKDDLVATAQPAHQPIYDVAAVSAAAARQRQISARRAELERERHDLIASLATARNAGQAIEEPLDAALSRIVTGGARPPLAQTPEEVWRRINEIQADLGLLTAAEHKSSSAFYRAIRQAAHDRLGAPDAEQAIRRVVAAAATLCREMAAARELLAGLTGEGWPVTDTNLAQSLLRANAAAVSPEVFAHWLAAMEAIVGRPLTGRA